jgi:cholesterol transport system auxiliary component
MKKLIVLLALALAGCLNLGDKNDSVVVNYVLEDVASASTPVAAADPRTLLVPDTTAAPYYDSDSLIYSKSPGTRAKYRYARWTERPGKRFADLLRTRLTAQSGFAAVASGGQIHGDLLLDTDLAEFYHDATSAPGSVRVVLRAELVDLKSRRLLAHKTFEEHAALTRYDADSAARAFNQAASQTLNDVVAWLAVARLPAAVGK